MAGRKEAEQRRPSQIKGALIKGLVCFPFPPLTGRRGGEGGGGGGRWLHAEAVEDILNEQPQPVAAPLHCCSPCVSYTCSQCTFSTASFIHSFHVIVQ